MHQPLPLNRAFSLFFLLGLLRCGGGDPAAPPATGGAGTSSSSGSSGDGGDAGTGGSSEGQGGASGDSGAAGEAGAGGDVSCALGVLGDLSQPIDFKISARAGDGVSVPLQEGGDAPLITPPQGGRVILIGVRATNTIPCSMKLSAALRDKDSGQVRLDSRTINLKPDGDGWGSSVDSNLATFAHIPTCPNQWASGDVYGRPYELEVTLSDKAGRSLTKTMTVSPQCSEPAFEKECLCICKQGYKLGAPCP